VRLPCGAVETIGRDKSNSIVIQDAVASRNHALIRRVGSGQFYILDVGSRNGTFINEQRVTTPTLLSNGDKIVIGETVITFEQETVKEAPKGAPNEAAGGETISFVRSNLRAVAILVADIRGYTSMSERIEITALSKLMSDWFYEVQTLIEGNNGRVDKFIGDCVMALWDGEVNPTSTILACLRVADGLQELTRSMGQEQLGEDLRIGVGINMGIAAVGIGQENTAMGNTINIAFRLESASKDLNKDIVISQNAYSFLPSEMWSGREQEIQVKGKKIPIRVAALSFAELKEFLATATNEAGAGPTPAVKEDPSTP
jgi:adenylate cyclase